MRVILDVFREADGRLEGRVQLPDGHADTFASTLDLLRVLEGLDLTPPTCDPGPRSPAGRPEESRG